MPQNSMFVDGCAHTEFLNISLLQSETLRQRNLSRFPGGAQTRERTAEKRPKSRPPLLQLLASSCLSGVYILQGLEKLEQLKTKAFYPSIAFPGPSWVCSL